MVTKQKVHYKTSIVPPYITKLENGAHVRFDSVDEIQSELSFKSFSLSVNLNNGENLKESKIEPINMLQEVNSIAERCADLSSQIESWQKSQELEKRISKLNEPEQSGTKNPYDDGKQN